MSGRIENLLRQLHINKRIFAVLVASILLFTVCLLVLSNLIVRNIMSSEYYQNDMQRQSETAQSINALMTDVNLLSVRLIGDDELYRIFRSTTVPYEEKSGLYRSYISKIAQDTNVANVVVVDNSGEVFSAKEIKGHSFDSNLLSKIDIKSDHLGICGFATDESGKSYVVLGRRYFFYSTSASIGYIFLYFPESEISQILMAGNANSTAMLVTGDGLVFSATDPEKCGTTMLDPSILSDNGYQHYNMQYGGIDSICTTSRIPELEHTLNGKIYTVNICPKSNLYRSMNQLSLIIVIVEAGIMLLAVLLALKNARKIVKPIHKLQNNISNFGRDGELVPSYIKHEDADDEFAELENAYNEMLNRIIELTNKNIDEKLEQRKLQLDALQAQINPHFLYNTLDTIVWIAKMKKQKEIEELAMALAGFFRISLHKGDKFISVREELDFVKGFVLIQQTRFPDKFDYVSEVPDELLDCKIFKISIQPFVENAIKHGIAPKDGRGCITVKAWRDGEDLVVTVHDDGVGINKKTAAENQGELVGLNGYGIQNVDERIRLEYGQNYGVSIDSTPGVGTTVCVKMPFILE